MISNWLTESFLQWLACVLVVLPLIAVATRRERKNGRSIALQRLIMLALFFFISLALARSDTAFQWLPSPWQGMVLEGVFAFSVILATQTVQFSGINLKISRNAWRDVLFATLLLLVFVAIRSAALQFTGISGTNQGFGYEFLIFQLTLPGITEELVYRGVIQSHLNNMYSKPWQIWKITCGWGLIVTTILFWAVHAFQVNGWEVSFHWKTLTLPLVVGLVLGWMRERSNSLVPSIIAHNLVNFLVTII